MLSGSRRCQSYDHLETPGFIAPTNEQGTPAWVPPTWCSLDFAGPALVAQWIEQRFPKPRAEVRFLPGALTPGGTDCEVPAPLSHGGSGTCVPRVPRPDRT